MTEHEHAVPAAASADGEGKPGQRHTFAVLNSTVVAESPIFTLRRDLIAMPGGRTATREVVEHFGAVAVLAWNPEQDAIAMVNQYRVAAARHFWELPAGLLDIAGEDPLETARRELLEEAGLEATGWALLTDVVTSAGFSDEACRVYLATSPTPALNQPEKRDEEADLEVHWVPVARAEEMLLAGEVVNSIALAGILTFLNYRRANRPWRSVDEPFPTRPHALSERRQARGARPGEDMKPWHQGGFIQDTQ